MLLEGDWVSLPHPVSNEDSRLRLLPSLEYSADLNYRSLYFLLKTSKAKRLEILAQVIANMDFELLSIPCPCDERNELDLDDFKSYVDGNELFEHFQVQSFEGKTYIVSFNHHLMNRSSRLWNSRRLSRMISRKTYEVARGLDAVPSYLSYFAAVAKTQCASAIPCHQGTRSRRYSFC